MSLLHYAKRAAVRRVVFVLVALALAYVGIGDARAQDYSDCNDLSVSGALCPSKADAVAAALAQAESHLNWEYKTVCRNPADDTATRVRAWATPRTECETTPQGWIASRYFPAGVLCAEGGSWDPVTETCGDPLPTEAECLARPEVIDTWALPDNPEQVVCSEGCIYGAYHDPVTDQNYFSTFNDDTSAWFGACAVGEFEEPQPDTDGDGVADTNDTFPNDPNESGDADSDGVGDNADTNDGDADNGADGGTGDETDNLAAGSGSCAAPPTCSGDAIQCEILFTNWKISCSGAVVAGSPEQCGAPYACTGDTAQCAQVALLRKTACEGVGQGGAAGDADANGVADVLESPVSDIPGETPGLGTVDGGALWGQVDQDGWLTGGTCPGLPTITSLDGFGAVSAKLCEFGDVLAGLFLAAAMAGAAYIIGRAATGV